MRMCMCVYLYQYVFVLWSDGSLMVLETMFQSKV